MIVGPPGVRVHAAVAGVLAQTPAPPPADPAAGRGEEFGKTSPLALVVIVLLALATIILIRSMNKRLRNVPASFDPPAQGDEPTDGGDRGAGGARDEPAPDAPAGHDADDSTTGTSQLRRTDGPPRAGSP